MKNYKHSSNKSHLECHALFTVFFKWICVTKVTYFRPSFNIFDACKLKTNLSYIIQEHKLRGKMLRNIFAITWLSVFCLVAYGQENRSYSGYGNNLENRSWGAAHTPVVRMTSTHYADGMGAIDNKNRPIPREISNRLFEQNELILDDNYLSDFVWVFGQFIDHDVTLIENNPAETVLLEIPSDDEYFDENEFIVTARNKVMPGSGEDISNPRIFPNEISSFIDASAVYGSDDATAAWLRTFEDGKLKTSEGDLLPWNTISGEYDDEIDPAAPHMADDTRQLTRFFVAGDIRANENPLLVGMHTIFVREHNRLCDELKERHPQWSDEQLYQQARRLVGAYIQNICFYEWLPSLGVYLPEYNSYDADLNPAIFNVFSAAAFRIGHTLINSNILRMDNDGDELAEGSMQLQDAFFNPFTVVYSGGIEPFFKGMGAQVMQKLDCRIIGDLRNFLFGVPGAGGLDLAAINIFRGRDRGLGDYNSIRADFGLPLVKNFSDFVGDSEDAAALEALYGDVNNVDPWVGMLAERHLPGSIFGELVMRIIESQFQILRDADRFYFENDPAFTPSQIEEIKSTKLYDIVMRNSNLSIMQKNLFVAMPHSDIPEGPELIGNEALAAALYPNPAYDQSTMKLELAEASDVNITIFNYSGQLMSRQQVSAQEGKNLIDLELDAYWPRGFYNVLVESGEQYTILKLVKE